MLKDKAMIIIAVSKYAGAYGNLPGAITSANRLRSWAEDEGYKVLYLADDVFDKIDVQLVSQEISRFVNNNFIDRLGMALFAQQVNSFGFLLRQQTTREKELM